MKLFTYLVLVAPLALANPLPAPKVQLKAAISEKAAAPANLFKRERTCVIVTSDPSIALVNCRSGPGTNYPILASLSVGGRYSFKCRKVGQCLNNGAGGVDCGWDYNDVPAPACYVWEDYTDTNCAPNLLPVC